MTTFTFFDIAARAGFSPAADGKLNLPATQETADALAAAALELAGPWVPGSPKASATITGAGPVWGFLAIAHALHGRFARLQYAAPNTDGPITVFNHGFQE